MEKKIIKILKIIAIIFVVILVIELGYIGYCAFFKKDETVYFDGVNALCVTDNGYVSVGSNNNNDKQLEKAKITKYDKDKNKVFEILYNKGYNGSFFGISKDNDNNYIAVGSYEASKEEHESDVRSALIVKYDNDGQILFDKDFQVLGNSKFTNILVVDDGYIVSGQSIYENSTLGFSSDGGAILVKYSKEGKILWKQNYGGSKSAVYNDLIIEDEYIFVVGKDYSNVGIISKYDMNGNHIKTSEYKYTDSIGFSGIVSVNDSLFVSTAKNISDSQDNKNIDAMIVKYNLDCDYLDEVVYSTKYVERYNKIIKDSHDNIITIGTKVLNGREDTLNCDGLLAKYDSSLEKGDVITYGDERDDRFTDIKLVGNNYLVTGYSSYEDGSYLSKFISYSDALKILEVQ